MDQPRKESFRISPLLRAALGVTAAFMGLALSFVRTMTFWEAFAALLAISAPVFFALYKTHHERAETFRRLSLRSREWRERWAHEHAWPPAALDAYTHLSAEKFRAYQRGLVDPEVWETWRTEMELFFSKDAFVEHWHLKQNSALYGFHPSLISNGFPRDLDAVIARKIAHHHEEAS